MRNAEREDERELMDALKSVSHRYKVADFDAAALRRDLEQDIRVLRQLVELVEPITPAQDAKLQTLLDWLARDPLRQGKRLIFTQYADTARYLARQPEPGRPARGYRGDLQRAARARHGLWGALPPKANPAYTPGGGEREMDTLIATDVLAEGLNLQDCDKMINYDLHWNPVRLIQRFGAYRPYRLRA